MSVLKKTFTLTKQVISPKNYMPVESTQNLTEMPDTLVLDDNGWVRVNYRDSKVQSRINKVLSDFREVPVQNKHSSKER